MEEIRLRFEAGRKYFEEAQNRRNAEMYVSDFRDLLPDLFDALPGILGIPFAKLHTQHEKEVFLVGALGVLSGMMPNVSGYYMGNEMHPNLYCYVLGKYGVGKGVLNLARHLGTAVHEYKREQAKAMKKAHAAKQEEYERKRKLYQQGKLQDAPEPPDAPQLHRLYIPANSTKSAIIKLLEENDGKGIIFETESDTLTGMLRNKEHGNFTDVLRAAFHHEPVALYRKTNDEDAEIAHPQLSVVLSGTHEQLYTLIPDVENGLFSRFCYYILQGTDEYLFPFRKELNDRKPLVEAMGKAWLLAYQTLEALTEPILFELAPAQEQRFAQAFAQRKHDLRNNISHNLDGTIHRMGNIMFRIAMILTMVRRQVEELPMQGRIVCTDADFEMAFDISLWLLQYSLKVYEEIAPIQPPHMEHADNLQYKSRQSDKDEVCRLYKEGNGPREIARILYGGKKVSTIHAWIKNCVQKQAS